VGRWLSTCFAAAEGSAGDPSLTDGDEFDEVLEPAGVGRVARLEPRGVRVSGRRDQEVHHPAPRLAAGVDDGG
jgi:hypothetical protein